MKTVAKLVPAFSIAAILALGACSSETTDAPEPESEPVQTLQVVDRGFDQPEALADYLSEPLDEVQVRLESESNPDYDEDVDADRLYVDFASAGKTNEDMEATAAVVQTVSQATFDFDVLMVTGDGSAGEWSYLYNPATIDELTQGGQITVSEVWDAAEQDFDTIHR